MRLVTASTLPKSGKDLPNEIGGLRLMIEPKRKWLNDPPADRSALAAKR